jgi:hypothetical protein
MYEAIPACVPGFLEEPCGKTIVLSYPPFITRLPSHTASLWSNILVQKNNVRETCPEMSNVNGSHMMWAQSDVFGLFSESVDSWPVLVTSDEHMPRSPLHHTRRRAMAL